MICQRIKFRKLERRLLFGPPVKLKRSKRLLLLTKDFYYKQYNNLISTSKQKKEIFKMSSTAAKTNLIKFSFSLLAIIILLASLGNCDLNNLNLKQQQQQSPDYQQQVKHNSHSTNSLSSSSHKEKLASSMLVESIERQHSLIDPLRALVQQRPSKFDSGTSVRLPALAAIPREKLRSNSVEPNTIQMTKTKTKSSTSLSSNPEGYPDSYLKLYEAHGVKRTPQKAKIKFDTNGGGGSKVSQDMRQIMMLHEHASSLSPSHSSSNKIIQQQQGNSGLQTSGSKWLSSSLFDSSIISTGGASKAVGGQALVQSNIPLATKTVASVLSLMSSPLSSFKNSWSNSTSSSAETLAMGTTRGSSGGGGGEGTKIKAARNHNQEQQQRRRRQPINMLFSARGGASNLAASMHKQLMGPILGLGQMMLASPNMAASTQNPLDQLIDTSADLKEPANVNSMKLTNDKRRRQQQQQVDGNGQRGPAGVLNNIRDKLLLAMGSDQQASSSSSGSKAVTTVRDQSELDEKRKTSSIQLELPSESDLMAAESASSPIMSLNEQPNYNNHYDSKSTSTSKALSAANSIVPNKKPTDQSTLKVGSWLRGNAGNLAQSYFQDSLRDWLTLSQLPIFSGGPVSTAPSELEPGGKQWLAQRAAAAQQAKGNRTQTLEDILRFAYIFGTGVRRKRDPLKILSPTPTNSLASSAATSLMMSIPTRRRPSRSSFFNRNQSLFSSSSSLKQQPNSNNQLAKPLASALANLSSLLMKNRNAKPRGVMWDMATDPTLAVTVLHLMERASVALPLGFLLMPFVQMVRTNPLHHIPIDVARILPARASHRSVDMEELAKRLDMVDKILSRTLRPTHREAFR